MACGCVLEGGFEEFWGFLPRVASSSATRAVNTRICSACHSIRATTAGGSEARIPGDSVGGASMRTARLLDTAVPGYADL